jgi:uncharacterized protein YjiS (DUF1127 family)
MSCRQTTIDPCRHPVRGIPLAGTERRLRRAALAYLRHTLALWLGRSSQRRDLAALDAHLLKDIGVTPGQAAREAAKPFWLE